MAVYTVSKLAVPPKPVNNQEPDPAPPTHTHTHTHTHTPFAYIQVFIRHVRGGMMRIFTSDIHSPQRRSEGPRLFRASSSFSNLAMSGPSKWVTAGKRRN